VWLRFMPCLATSQAAGPSTAVARSAKTSRLTEHKTGLSTRSPDSGVQPHLTLHNICVSASYVILNEDEGKGDRSKCIKCMHIIIIMVSYKVSNQAMKGWK
jgi:hypothetical protein